MSSKLIFDKTRSHHPKIFTHNFGTVFTSFAKALLYYYLLLCGAMPVAYRSGAMMAHKNNKNRDHASAFVCVCGCSIIWLPLCLCVVYVCVCERVHAGSCMYKCIVYIIHMICIAL